MKSTSLQRHVAYSYWTFTHLIESASRTNQQATWKLPFPILNEIERSSWCISSYWLLVGCCCWIRNHHHKLCLIGNQRATGLSEVAWRVISPVFSRYLILHICADLNWLHLTPSFTLSSIIPHSICTSIYRIPVITDTNLTVVVLFSGNHCFTSFCCK